MGICTICGNSIKNEELYQNFRIRIGNFEEDKFRAETVCYFHARCLAKSLNQEVMINNLTQLSK